MIGFIGFLKALIPVAKFAGNLLGVKDVAGRLNISPRTVFELIRSKKVKSYKIGGKRMFYENELQNFIEKTSQPEVKNITGFSINLGRISFQLSINWNR